MKVIIDDEIVDTTPEIVADLFANMDSEEQAKFYNRIAEASSNWLYMQLQYITEEDGLTYAGRRVMQGIGDYSHWGIVCKDIAKINAKYEL